MIFLIAAKHTISRLRQVEEATGLKLFDEVIKSIILEPRSSY